jgi:hypothetical protein
LAILGCLGRSLGQGPTSAKSESDWIHFVTPRRRRETTNGAKSNPFIAPEGYRNYIASYEKSYRDQILREESGKGK